MNVLWFVLKERNGRCFDGKASSWESLVEKVKFFVTSWVFVLPPY